MRSAGGFQCGTICSPEWRQFLEFSDKQTTGLLNISRGSFTAAHQLTAAGARSLKIANCSCNLSHNISLPASTLFLYTAAMKQNIPLELILLLCLHAYNWQLKVHSTMIFGFYDNSSQPSLSACVGRQPICQYNHRTLQLMADVWAASRISTHVEQILHLSV